MLVCSAPTMVGRPIPLLEAGSCCVALPPTAACMQARPVPAPSLVVSLAVCGHGWAGTLCTPEQLNCELPKGWSSCRVHHVACTCHDGGLRAYLWLCRPLTGRSMGAAGRVHPAANESGSPVGVLCCHTQWG